MRDVPVVEPMVIVDTFVTDALSVTTLGNNVRLTLLSRERASYDDATVQDAVVSKIVASRDDMQRIATLILRACDPADKPVDIIPSAASCRRH